MAGMKRFVTYIYAYEEQRKGSNVGFARLDIRGEECRIEIHLRGVHAGRTVCTVCLFRVSGGEIEGIPIGEMRLVNGMGDFGSRIKAGHIGESPFGMGDMEGIFLLTGDERIFMSRWKEGEPLAVGLEIFHLWKPQKETPPEEVIAKAAELPEEIIAEVAEPTEEVMAEAAELPEDISEDELPEAVPEAPAKAVLEEEPKLQATEVPMRNIFPDYEWREIWEKLIQNHKCYQPFEDVQAECIQIELKNLRELPKRYWYLGNNSFLLHGFFNYHYLVVGKNGEGRWFLGVPGVYQKQERVMAAIFGFPEFIAVAQEEADETQGEPVNRFGCWYRYIEE